MLHGVKRITLQAMPSKVILFSFAALLATAPATAQTRARSGLGYLAGPQAAKWRSERANYRPVAGAVAGLYAPVWAARRLEVVPELVLSFAGTGNTTPDGATATLRTLEAALPLNAKYYLADGFNLQAGVRGGYLLWATSAGEDARDGLSKLDMGVSIGLGLGSRKGLDLSLRYYNGRSNLLAQDEHLFPASRSVQFTVGKRFMPFTHRRLRR